MVTAGDWILGQTIGSGATSTVHLASTVTSGEIFAVKSSPITSSALLKREQSILCSLSSPHIISCLGSDSSTDSYHLFLELAGKGTLSDIAGRVDEPEIRAIAHQILTALCYLKSNGLAHCDIKGRNILIGSDGRVKLGDFGCARRVGGEEIAPLIVMGTPAFMAPEVARGEEQGFAGDIWSLGCTMVELATGLSPWPEITDPVSALCRIGFTNETPIIPEWFSEEGKDFVSKCFVRDSKQRWTAEELMLHPFVAAPPPNIFLKEKQGRWVSPKSTLELNSWELESENDEEDELIGFELESFTDGIRGLSSSAPANWSWSESWIPVRSNSEEEEEEKRETWFAGEEEEVSCAGDDNVEAEEELASSSYCCVVEAEYGTEMDLRALYWILLIGYFIISECRDYVEHFLVLCILLSWVEFNDKDSFR